MGCWGLWKIPRLRAAHEADIALHVFINGEIVEYAFEQAEVAEYYAKIEHTVDGHRYGITAAEAVSTPGQIGEKVRIAYTPSMASDAIDAPCDFSWEIKLAKSSLVDGMLLVVIGLRG